MIINSCKKKDDNTSTGQVPVLTTSAVTNIAATTATCGGDITSDGGATVTARGVCWSTGQTPTIADNKTNDGTGAGSFTSNITGLTQNTTYYVRAYATNSAGTGYGSAMSYTTIATSVIAIGLSYQGGIIAYILQPGDPSYDANIPHGLIVAPSDQGVYQWGCSSTNISGATGTALGTGLSNTIAIVNGCSTTNTAARICYDLVLTGYSDWYLPSKDELNLIYLNLFQQGLGNLASNDYWSSSEVNDSYSWTQNFTDSNPYNTMKTAACVVRAVRAF